MTEVVAVESNRTNAPVVAADVAEQEFERFAEAMTLDIDPSGMRQEDADSLAAARRIFVRAVMDGRLVVNTTGEPTFTTHDGTQIVFHEPTGAALMAADQKKRDASVTKLLAIMAEITGKPIAFYANMKERDLKVCRTITNLFLG